MNFTASSLHADCMHAVVLAEIGAPLYQLNMIKHHFERNIPVSSLLQLYNSVHADIVFESVHERWGTA